MIGPATEFSQVGDGHYRLGLVKHGVCLDVERLRREKGELIGELSVGCDIPGARTVDGYLSIADWNLSSARARSDRAKILAERSTAPDVDWLGLLEELAQRTIKAERQGTPAKPLHTYQRSEAPAQFNIGGFRLLRDHQTILFGDGGSLKSMLALYAAGTLARDGISVLYADWELSGEDHRYRLEKLFGVDLPIVHYIGCDRPLIHEADRIGREVRRLGVDFLICDSIAFATAGPPEAAEHAMAYCRAVRQIGVGSLHLAHINKSENGDQKPFGSSFWHNSARLTWFVKVAAEQQGDRIKVGLINRKNNVGPYYQPVGFEVEFARDATRIESCNAADVKEVAEALPISQRMKMRLTRGPMTVAELADELGAKVDTIDRTLRRHNGLFTRVLSVDGIQRIALVERRAS